ncbi:MAG: flagellar motor protein MotB [Cellvibrionaceae bacterium]|nr:flagellar motor protein MotB [Cellvibrionaceae bacterium]
MAKSKPGQDAGKPSVIIIRKNKGHGHGHHGGSWKVALADFMTAMMAFFLLMWLLETATPKELRAIAGYFQAPGAKPLVGPGGANASAIDLTAAMMENQPRMEAGTASPLDAAGILGDSPEDSPTETEKELEEIPADESENSVDALAEQLAAVERKQLEELAEQLVREINNLDSALNLLKDQIRLEFTDLGLSIQVIDRERRTMFNEGSARLRDYSEDALHALAPIIDKVPNRISIVGHTDAKPYSPGAVYSNWELSSDRAHSARRALLTGGYTESKVIAVQGMASKAPFVPSNPTDPSNRRIAIVVLKQQVADAMMKVDPDSGQDILQNPGAAREASRRIMTEKEIERAIDAGHKP